MELSWDWPTIACVLMWKLAPDGVVITRKDLGALPQDRVMLDERLGATLKLSFVTVKQATLIRELLAKQSSVGVSTLDGRWQKIAVVLLWKLRKGGITLTESDRAQVPHDKTILAHGHRDGVEFRFMPKSEATRLTAWDRDNEQKLIKEVVQ